jgi:hypothetical protein
VGGVVWLMLAVVQTSCEHMFEQAAVSRGVAVDERPGYVPIVREPDLRRLAAASRAVLAEFERVRELVGHRPEILAHLYAGSAVRADDDYGRSAGLVIQADELRWAELDELVRFAEAQVEAGQHGGSGAWHPGCRDCQAVLAMARIRSRHRYRTVGPAGDPGDPGGAGGPGSAGGAGGADQVSGAGSPAEGGTANPDRAPP